MGMTSAAEAKLAARVRPDIVAMRARTPYPHRRTAGAVPVTTSSTEPKAAQATAARGSGLATVVPLAAAAARRERRLAESAPARPIPATRTPVRLTRRGRIVVGVLAVIGAAALASLIWLAVAGRAEASSQLKAVDSSTSSVQRVVVTPGETLWGIATAVDPGADPRIVIPQIVELNSLRSTEVSAGEVLWVPKS